VGNAEVERRQEYDPLLGEACKNVNGDDQGSPDEFFADRTLCCLAEVHMKAEGRVSILRHSSCSQSSC
jgi:hypothetical protein